MVEIRAIHASGSSGKHSAHSFYPNFPVAIDGIAALILTLGNLHTPCPFPSLQSISVNTP
jgi:hypothetical protein